MNLLVADESVDFQLIQELRKHGYRVLSILENSPGISDNKVLQISNSENALLITEDKDFGELLTRFGKSHCGVLLIRFPNLPLEKRKRLLLDALDNHINEMKNSLSILSKKKLRIKKA